MLSRNLLHNFRMIVAINLPFPLRKGVETILVQNSSVKVALGGCSLSYWIRAQVHVAFSPGREKARMRGHDRTLTSISPVADCVAIRQRISVAVSVISTPGRNLRSLTFVRDDNALNNALQHSFSRQRKKNRSGNLVISNRKRSKKHLLITTSLGRL